MFVLWRCLIVRIVFAWLFRHKLCLSQAALKCGGNAETAFNTNAIPNVQTETALCEIVVALTVLTVCKMLDETF